MNERLKMIRETSGLNMRDFSERLGMSHGAISLLETGKRNMTSQFINSVCREFGINEDWLRSGEGEMMKPLDREGEIARITDQMLDEVEPSIRNSLHRIVADMTAQELEIFLKYARRLVEEMDEKNLPS